MRKLTDVPAFALKIAPSDLPKTRRESLEWYADLEGACGSGNSPFTWREVERELGLVDLWFLLVRLLRRQDLNTDWHHARAREVQQRPDWCLDLWGREGGKSSLITFGLTVQDILRDPEITCCVFSHVRPLAKGFLRQVKVELETNELLKSIYSDVLWANPQREAIKWSEDDGIVVKRKGNPRESTLEAFGLVDGMPTGRHYRLRIYDDVVTRESVTTGEMMKKTLDALDLSDNLGVAIDQGGAARYIGTRYALQDAYATLIQRGQVTPRIYAATHNGRMNGRPVYFSEAEWQRRLKSQSRAIIAAQMLQNPLADEAKSFRPEWLRSYEIRPRTLSVGIMCDPSLGRSAASDSTAIAVVGLASNGAKFLLDGYCHRMSLSQRWRALRTVYHKWARLVGVGRIQVGYERYGMQSDLEYFEDQMAIERRNGIPNCTFAITELNWPREGGHSKRERVERLEPDFRNSRFFLPVVVVHEGRPCRWRVQGDPDIRDYGQVEYIPLEGPTKAERQAMEGGSTDLVAKAIRQRDEDGVAYDLTAEFLRQYLEFPAGSSKDLIDAVSRVFDLELPRPVVMSQADTEPPTYWDR